ncbi:hypothetical protein BLOT_006845 [Blomia tropicalis]|nr:hypothetical protein BLOT_006845 [Blomia tropicalis]
MPPPPSSPPPPVKNHLGVPMDDSIYGCLDEIQCTNRCDGLKYAIASTLNISPNVFVSISTIKNLISVSPLAISSHSA